MSGCDRIKLVHRIIPIAICAIVVLAVLYVAYRLLFPKSARARRKTSRDFPGASIARIRKTLSMHRLSGRANAIHAHGDEILSKVLNINDILYLIPLQFYNNSSMPIIFCIEREYFMPGVIMKDMLGKY